MVNFFSFLILGAIFFGFRIDSYTLENAIQSLNADNTTFGMMAEEILLYKKIPIYFYGQNYMGPLSSLVIALTQLMRNSLGVVDLIPFYQTPFNISPVSIVIGASSLVFIGIFGWFLTLRRLFSVGVGFFCAAALTLCSPLLLAQSLRPLGAEMAFAFSPYLIMMYLYVLSDLKSLQRQLSFGLLFGFAWWMNQTIVFVFIPIAFHFVSRTEIYQYFRHNISWPKLLTLRFGPHIQISNHLRYLLIFLYALATLFVVLGLYVISINRLKTIIFGIKLHIPNGLSCLKIAILIFFVTQFFIHFKKVPQFRKKLLQAINSLKFFMIGAFVGYAPVILGKLLGWYEKAYTPKLRIIIPSVAPKYWRELLTDFLPELFLGEKWSELQIYSQLTYIILMALLLFTLYQHRRSLFDYLSLQSINHSKKSLVWGIILFNFLYICISERSRSQGALRYGILCLPLVFTFLLTRFNRKKLCLSILSTVLIISISYSGYTRSKNDMNMINQGHGITLPVLKALSESDYILCYSDYWKGEKFEFLTSHKVNFIVNIGQRRRDALYREREKSATKKCVLEMKGKQVIVRPVD